MPFAAIEEEKKHNSNNSGFESLTVPSNDALDMYGSASFGD